MPPTDRRTGAVGARPVDDPDRKRIGDLDPDVYTVRHAITAADTSLEVGTCAKCGRGPNLRLVDVADEDDGTVARWCERCVLEDAR